MADLHELMRALAHATAMQQENNRTQQESNRLLQEVSDRLMLLIALDRLDPAAITSSSGTPAAALASPTASATPTPALELQVFTLETASNSGTSSTSDIHLYSPQLRSNIMEAPLTTHFATRGVRHGNMDRNALAELLQALESRRDAEERRREERYTALIERSSLVSFKLSLLMLDPWAPPSWVLGARAPPYWELETVVLGTPDVVVVLAGAMLTSAWDPPAVAVAILAEVLGSPLLGKGN
ncbi:UNVERIFIED_CONTAM: hypothetical protein FKN15_069397 [Acipenser sinensis]